MKISDLTDVQKDEFFALFYDKYCPDGLEDYNNCNPSPWGSPWHWDYDEASGDTLDALVKNYASLVNDDIIEELKIEEDQDCSCSNGCMKCLGMSWRDFA